ncbi:MAG: hypothetical protein KQH57_04745 [Actinomycetales bacterium]|nr:hypothetical protein [Actinomycetales bacterium]
MNETLRYEFRFAERLSQTVQHAFPGLHVSATSDHVLYGPLVDQDELEGLIARFSLLRLTLLEMHRLPD